MKFLTYCNVWYYFALYLEYSKLKKMNSTPVSVNYADLVGNNVPALICKIIQENEQQIKSDGKFQIPITADLLGDFESIIQRWYEKKDEFPFDPETYHGYQKRPSQQEIICLRSDEVVSDLYKVLLQIAEGVVLYFGHTVDEARLSPVYWRYDPENNQSDALGFDVHKDFSLGGVTFQCSRGLFEVNDDREIDVWEEYGPCILVTFGSPSEAFGFTPFNHGVKRSDESVRYAGGVFIDIISNDGNDGVAEKMEEYDSQV